MLARNWKHQWLPLCLARHARRVSMERPVAKPMSGTTWQRFGSGSRSWTNRCRVFVFHPPLVEVRAKPDWGQCQRQHTPGLGSSACAPRSGGILSFVQCRQTKSRQCGLDGFCEGGLFVRRRACRAFRSLFNQSQLCFQPRDAMMTFTSLWKMKKFQTTQSNDLNKKERDWVFSKVDHAPYTWRWHELLIRAHALSRPLLAHSNPKLWEGPEGCLATRVLCHDNQERAAEAPAPWGDKGCVDLPLLSCVLAVLNKSDPCVDQCGMTEAKVKCGVYRDCNQTKRTKCKW